MRLNRNPQRLHGQRHLAAQILHAVDRRNREVAFLLARLVAEIGALLLSRIPDAFLGVDLVIGVVDALAVTHVVEHEELRLRAEIGDIGHAYSLEMRLGFLGDVAGVAAVRFAGERVADVADQDQGRCRGIRVEEGRGRIRHDQHVAFLDLLKAADRRPVEANAFFHGILVERARRDRKMLPSAGQVGKAQVDHSNVVVLHRLEYVLGRGTIKEHMLPPVFSGASLKGFRKRRSALRNQVQNDQVQNTSSSRPLAMLAESACSVAAGQQSTRKCRYRYVS